jgi:hypothetical protein
MLINKQLFDAWQNAEYDTPIEQQTLYIHGYGTLRGDGVMLDGPHGPMPDWMKRMIDRKE